MPHHDLCWLILKWCSLHLEPSYLAASMKGGSRSGPADAAYFVWMISVPQITFLQWFLFAFSLQVYGAFVAWLPAKPVSWGGLATLAVLPKMSCSLG